MVRVSPLRLHVLLARFQKSSRGKEAQYPLTCKAMAELSDALMKEAPRKKWNARGSHRSDLMDAYGRSRVQAWRAKKKITDLEIQLKKFTESKTVGGRISEEWLLRTILTAPHVSGRALAEVFHLAIGSDSNVINKESIGAVRSIGFP